MRRPDAVFLHKGVGEDEELPHHGRQGQPILRNTWPPSSGRARGSQKERMVCQKGLRPPAALKPIADQTVEYCLSGHRSVKGSTTKRGETPEETRSQV